MHFKTEFPYLLGSTNPWPIAVHMEPFSTSVFEVRSRIFATTTKICTGARFTQAHAQGCVTSTAPSYSSPPHSRSDGRVSAARLSAIHFRGWSIRQVSCYTLLSGFRLPWPPSCCLDGPTPFVVSDERAVWRLNPTLGATLIASSAYQKWPTKDTH